MAVFKMWTWDTSLLNTLGNPSNDDLDGGGQNKGQDEPDLFNSLTEKNPSYTNCTVQQYFPKKVSHTLLNGNVATFTPNVRHRITIDFAFITASQYQILLNNFNKLVLIQPESGTSANFIPTGLRDISGTLYNIPKLFKVLWMDDGINFTYSDTYKGAGYSGAVNFLDMSM